MKKTLLLCFLPLTTLVSAQPAGSSLFDETRIVDVNIQFPDDDFWSQLYATYSGDYYIPASVTIDGNIYDSTGMKLKGNSSWGYPSDKKSFKLDFNEFISGQDIDGLKKLNFNNNFKDPTMLREKLFFDFCKTAGIPAPRANFARVYINGIYWGIYTMVDQIDKDYLDILFDDNDGNLFKGDPHGDLSYKGDLQSNYTGDYELHTNEPENDWSDLVDLIDVINNTDAADYESQFFSLTDATVFYSHWAVDNLFASLDSYIGSGHNYYIYHDSTDLKWKWILWDGNEAFGNFSNGIPNDQLSTLDLLYYASSPAKRPAIANAVANADMQQDYLNTIYILKESYFNPTYLYPVIDTYADLVRDAVYADTMKQFTDADFESNIDHNLYFGGPMPWIIPGLKQFIDERYTSVNNQLTDLGFVPNGISSVSADDAITVYPTLLYAGENLTIASVTDLSSSEVIICDCFGKAVLKTGISNQQISTEGLPAGFYVLSIMTGDGGQCAFKIVVQ